MPKERKLVGGKTLDAIAFSDKEGQSAFLRPLSGSRGHLKRKKKKRDGRKREKERGIFIEKSPIGKI